MAGLQGQHPIKTLSGVWILMASSGVGPGWAVPGAPRHWPRVGRRVCVLHGRAMESPLPPPPFTAVPTLTCGRERVTGLELSPSLQGV